MYNPRDYSNTRVYREIPTIETWNRQNLTSLEVSRISCISIQHGSRSHARGVHAPDGRGRDAQASGLAAALFFGSDRVVIYGYPVVVLSNPQRRAKAGISRRRSRGALYWDDTTAEKGQTNWWRHIVHLWPEI
eukprot:1358070-Amorphochlora_amoeboformis.AAC.1